LAANLDTIQIQPHDGAVVRSSDTMENTDLQHVVSPDVPQLPVNAHVEVKLRGAVYSIVTQDCLLPQQRHISPDLAGW